MSNLTHTTAINRTETRDNVQHLPTDLAVALGGETRPDAPSESSYRGALIVNGLPLNLSPGYGANAHRVTVSAHGPDVWRRWLTGGKNYEFPSITLDANRPLDAMASAIRKRVIEPAAAPLG